MGEEIKGITPNLKVELQEPVASKGIPIRRSPGVAAFKSAART